MSTKRKVADPVQDITATDTGTATLTEKPPTASPAAETASQGGVSGHDSTPPLGSDGKYHTLREPGEPQKSWVKRASVIVDPEAGVKFHFDYEQHKAIITFDEKPTQQILAVARPILNEGGFEWDKVKKDGWKTEKFDFLRREDQRREAKKTFYTLANAIREHKGLPARSFGEAMAF